MKVDSDTGGCIHLGVSFTVRPWPCSFTVYTVAIGVKVLAELSVETPSSFGIGNPHKESILLFLSVLQFSYLSLKLDMPKLPIPLS